MTGIGQDLRYAFRSLARKPGLAAAVIATLALGIGANVAVFSVVDGLLLRQLPVRQPGSLALLTWSARAWPKIVQDLEGSTRKDEATGETWTTSFPYPVYEAFAAHTRTFSSTFAIMANDPSANIRIAGHGASAVTRLVSGSFFDALGVRAQEGRLLLPADDRPGMAPVAVISHRFWDRMLGRDRSAIGRTIAVNGRSVLLVGVLPPAFFGLEPGAAGDVWLPLHSFGAVFGDYFGQGADLFQERSLWWIEIGGRLRPGAGLAAAREESRRIFESFLPRPASPGDPGRPVLAVRPIARGEDGTRHRVATPLLILFGLSALVLAVACTNVAGLLLARASSRAREIAIRRSLGANTARLVRQLLTESLVLSLLASVAAVAVADMLTSGVLALLARSRHPISLPSALPARVLLFGIAAAVVTGILAGLVPAWRASRADLTGSLKEAAPSGVGRPGRHHGADALVGAQIALGMLLVTAAGLFARTIVNLRRIDLGFRPDHVVLFTVRPGLNGYQGERLAGFYDDLRSRLAALPGVRAASLSLHGVIGGGASTTTVAIPGAFGSTSLDTHVHLVSPGYFDTLRIPIVAGRALDERDRSPNAPAVVVNRAFARSAFPNANPVGRAILLGEGPRASTATIVGLAGDARYNRVREPAPPTFYLTYRERPPAPDEMTFQVRVAGDASDAPRAIREAVAAVDPDLPVVDLETQEEAIESSLSMERVFTFLTSSFGALALVLAALGLYAALAFAVSRRTREIGVRIALGAARWQIRGMVMREALIPVVVGLGAGTAASAAFTRFLRSQLFGLDPMDPAVLASAAAVLAATAAAAAYVPARRASSVDPMTALRAE